MKKVMHYFMHKLSFRRCGKTHFTFIIQTTNNFKTKHAKMFKTISFIFFALSHIHLLTASISQHEITHLPGARLISKQYAGYIPLDQAQQKNIFYWLQESENNPATDPLVLWFNGSRTI